VTLQRLIIMRHGETDWNAGFRMQGHRDIPLNAKGLGQAAAAAPSVAAHRPDVIVSSDLQRARATAEVIADAMGADVRTDPRLRETSLGQWEGLDRDEVQARWPGQWEQWRHRGARMAPPGGESRLQVSERAARVVDELDAGDHEAALLVTHGGLIVGLTGRLLGIDPDGWGTLIGVSNCHWVALHRVAGRWLLHTYNGGLGGIVLAPRDEEIVED
jgi:2,3-bisphosphoglycerate-dependent phosphoglycerate mutase/probable phosphoglycerate mutase